MSLSMKDAFIKAKQEIEDLTDNQIKDIRLEEANKIRDSWNIGISYLTSSINAHNQKISAFTQPYERVYKEIHVDSSGNVTSIKMFKNDK